MTDEPERISKSYPHAEVSSSKTDEETIRLAQLKLKAEIASLNKSIWSNPGLIVPLVATAITLSYSQWVGIFDVKRDVLKLENEKAEFANYKLKLDREKLKTDIEKLDFEKVELKNSRDLLRQQKAEITGTLAKLETQLQAAQESTKIASEAYIKAKRDFESIYKSARTANLAQFSIDVRRCDGEHGLGYISDQNKQYHSLAARVRGSLLQINTQRQPYNIFIPPKRWHLKDVNALKSEIELLNCLDASRKTAVAQSILEKSDSELFDQAAKKLAKELSSKYLEIREKTYFAYEKVALSASSFPPPSEEEQTLRGIGPKYNSADERSVEYWAEIKASKDIKDVIQAGLKLNTELIQNIRPDAH